MGKILQFPSPEQRPNHEKEDNRSEEEKIDDLPRSDPEIISLKSRMKPDGKIKSIFSAEFILKLTEVLPQLGNLLQQITESRRANVGSVYQEMVKKYTPQELASYILEADEHKLSERPLFYKAIIEELDRRNLIMRSKR